MSFIRSGFEFMSSGAMACESALYSWLGSLAGENEGSKA